MSYDPPSRREGETSPLADPYADPYTYGRRRPPDGGDRGRPAASGPPSAGQRHRKGYAQPGEDQYRSLRDSYPVPRDDSRPTRRQPPRRAHQPAPRRPGGGRALLETLAAVVLVAVSAAVSWVVAAHHYEKANSAAGPSGAASSPAAAREPETAAAALSAANSFFALYGAGQYAAVYPMIAPTDRAVIRESVWTGVHRKCESAAAGLSYKVSHPVLSGATAVVTVGLTGVASAIGSEQATFTYSGGRWYYVPPDMQVYRGHDLTQAVAAAKTEGYCS